ncbi:MAG: hypothetical protein COW54_01915 [Rhodobacteraceae bacterium CG17_big_fil_post_rev_8_21_14_2_50_63_15]|nr:DUF1311 domain-containing protein [Roseovarius sp.]PIV79823.1 MAG: hypothetical protein COW54_01915 [Rhodobacteraceae bacterium CG17_big_fil_post_rev_8_21_14_2_50_63_15]
MRRLLVIVLVGPGAAAAQDLAVDVAVVRACHDAARAGDLSPPCVGAAADACQALPGGDTTLGISECLLAETYVWADLMQAEYERQAAALSAAPGDLGMQLAAAQAAWGAYREAECGLRYGYWIEGSIRTIMAADCHLEKTAARARELRDLGAME